MSNLPDDPTLHELMTLRRALDLERDTRSRLEDECRRYRLALSRIGGRVEGILLSRTIGPTAIALAPVMGSLDRLLDLVKSSLAEDSWVARKESGS